ncbi:uncharacterized protein LOC113314049 isoform X3 [Papaver somniferum]|uniref:uncharacterized protein LOC113314049 isoform X3 n=1 Tax=Papaver somniferum TaxID=3469 RepID=UPI000E6F73CA|nr:uncharacterized protein LOC113314049 isoform X3 [Papaver somniferum]
MWTMLRHSLLFVYGSLPAHGGIFTWMMLMPISYQDQWHLDVADCWDIHCFHLRSPLLLHRALTLGSAPRRIWHSLLFVYGSLPAHGGIFNRDDADANFDAIT